MTQTASHVATLIAERHATALTATMIARACAALPQADEAQWLNVGVAADIPFTPGANVDHRVTSETIRRAVAPEPIDVVVQGKEHRRKKLFVADMDSTMIRQECIDELADHVHLKAHVAAITTRAMRGEIEFAAALRARVALLKGLSVSTIEDVIAKRIELMPGGRALVATMRANGAYTCLVSGGFTLFTAHIGTLLGFDESRANILMIDQDGRLAGAVREPILGREEKLQALLDLRARLRLLPAETLAAGDGANDIPMIEAAGLGVAYHAKPAVAAAAQARIDHGDLTALLYAQGYRREEFVEV